MSIDFGNDIYEEPIVATTFLEEDGGEVSLRPKALRDYIGQEKAKENLSVFIAAAKQRTEPLDHVLLHGPPGLGKTTLAGIIAAEMGVNIRITSGPAIEKPGDLAALLTNLAENDILFVDEIHRLNRSVEEILYPAMVEITKDTIIGDILDVAPQTAPIFLSIGMHCLGCPSSRGETVEEACMRTSDILLPGVHNVENYLAAISAVDGLVPDEAIRQVARTFAGVEHRIELVRTLRGTRYYNDSIGTSPSRTIAGLRSFSEKVILIAGGYDKHIPFDVLGPEIVDHVKLLILCGATADKIRACVENAPNYQGQPEMVAISDFKAAVETASQRAWEVCRMYKNWGRHRFHMLFAPPGPPGRDEPDSPALSFSGRFQYP